MPFSYTVERNAGPYVLTLRMVPDGFHPVLGEAIGVDVIKGENTARIWHGFSQHGSSETAERFDVIESYAVALRWAVRYARRWNQKHGLIAPPSSPGAEYR